MKSPKKEQRGQSPRTEGDFFKLLCHFMHLTIPLSPERERRDFLGPHCGVSP